MPISAARAEGIRQRLLAWYATEARDLPWRQTDDPYAIWVSEVMLQQTRVETVLRYYRPFLSQFPTVHALAAAERGDVLKAWEGLGYYARARNLHDAAAIVVREWGGHVPSSVADLLLLPGIGRYTAPAIASIAFGVDVPVLDGNIIRVLSRLFRVSGDPSRAETRKLLLQHATYLTNGGKAAAVNQALMDLGARVCMPRGPGCSECCLASECDAHHRGEESEYPARPSRKPIPHIDVVAGVVWSTTPYAATSRILVAQRREDDMLGGLWEFPGGRVEQGETREEALVRELREELAIEVVVLQPLPTVDHAYSHFRMALHPFHCRHTGGLPRPIECAAWQWATIEEIDALSLSVADRRILEAVSVDRLSWTVRGGRPATA